MRKFNFKNSSLTEKSDPLVIAEIGINHNGILKEALDLASLAIENGAKFVKLQTHIASEEMSSEAKSIVPVHPHVVLQYCGVLQYYWCVHICLYFGLLYIR